MQVSDIIQQLNEDRTNRFPVLDVYCPIDVRLSAYRSDMDWALVIETFYFADARLPHENPAITLWCYGNNLPQAPGPCYPELHFTGDGPSGPLFDPKVDTLVAPSAKDMTIRGKVVPITTNPAEYAAAGIDLKLLSRNAELWSQLEAGLEGVGADLGQPPRIFGYELLRLIAPKYRRFLFCTEAEIAGHTGASMPLLIRLDEWRHPDITETPADSESFQMIADAIAHNDPSFYEPKEPPNTHWSNWPMAGMV
jgi:hypothetical protein